ncbi:MAG: ferrous iron transport protein A [Deltaproteobacteria bacterium]|nr:ferrous iron transport protein A [Deltaproteobacteria bacterium]
MRISIDRMKYNQEGVFVGINNELRLHLAGMGLRAGKKIKMITREPLKGPVVIQVDHASISLGIGIADKLIVEVDE